jgi:hypothetical protein
LASFASRRASVAVNIVGANGFRLFIGASLHPESAIDELTRNTASNRTMPIGTKLSADSAPP